MWCMFLRLCPIKLRRTQNERPTTDLSKLFHLLSPIRSYRNPNELFGPTQYIQGGSKSCSFLLPKYLSNPLIFSSITTTALILVSDLLSVAF